MIPREVDFDDIDSHYTNKLGKTIIICPKGKFHPYDFNDNNYIIPSGFEDRGGWDLRCYDHNTGFFLIFYLMNEGKNAFYYTDNNNINELRYFKGQIYDFKLENGNNGYNYEYFFPKLLIIMKIFTFMKEF